MSTQVRIKEMKAVYVGSYDHDHDIIESMTIDFEFNGQKKSMYASGSLDITKEEFDNLPKTEDIELFVRNVVLEELNIDETEDLETPES